MRRSIRTAAALVTALATVSPAGAALTGSKPLPIASAIPAPLPTAALGTCGPVQSGLGEVDGTINDPQISQHATQLVFDKSTVIVYPFAADPNNTYLGSISNAVSKARTMAMAQRGAQNNQNAANATTESTENAAIASISAMENYGIAQAAAAGAYSAVGSQSESAEISGKGQFRCLGLPLGAAIQMIVTEFFTDNSGATITRYYQGVGAATKISATGLPTSFLLLGCVGSIPYSLQYPSDNCPAPLKI